MKNADIVIIGGGMVGLSLAALLAGQDCQIKIIEKNPPKLTACGVNQRVSAINRRSYEMLKRAGAWQRIATEHLSPYHKMAVWEQDSFARLDFDNQDESIKPLGLAQLGFIVENTQIQAALWQQVCVQPNVELLAGTPQSIGVSEQGAFLTLESGEMIAAKLVVGADGAHSWLRKQTNIPLVSRDYQHTALVCTVRTAEPHKLTARQIFSPQGVLAFLPLKDEHLCSIVWSLPPERAEELQTCPREIFEKALTVAFDNRLGLCKLQNSRQIYPLAARYARDFAQPRIALIGDAAHTIHPLAGLGANLGFSDAQCLAEQIIKHLQAGHDIGEYRHLREFERVRKLEAMKLLTSMEGLKQLFSGDNPLKKALRGVGMSLTNQSGALKKMLIKQALGI